MRLLTQGAQFAAVTRISGSPVIPGKLLVPEAQVLVGTAADLMEQPALLKQAR